MIGIILSILLNGILMSFFRRFDKNNLGIGIVYFDEPKIIYIFTPIMVCLIMLLLGFRFKDTFFNSVIYTNIVIAIYNSLHYYIKQVPKIKKERQKEKDQAEEAQRRENGRKAILAEKEKKLKMLEEKFHEYDLKCDRIINCPKCEGFGECIICRSRIFNWTFHNYEFIREIFAAAPKAWDYDGKKIVNNDDELTGEYYRIKCPYCKGQGIAYAFFERRNEKCGRCKGTGKITKEARVKMDIGFKDELSEIECNECNGRGSFNVDYCHGKSLATHSEIKKYVDDGTDCVFDIALTNQNKEFYSKSKPRYS